jgi:tryptophan 2,3-dioxygenase
MLAEAAFEIDRRFQSWRHNHILMVRRQIGIRARGTGGTFFRDYLATTTGYYFFPELFEFRNDLTEAAGGEVLREDDLPGAPDNHGEGGATDGGAARCPFGGF